MSDFLFEAPGRNSSTVNYPKTLPITRCISSDLNGGTSCDLSLKEKLKLEAYDLPYSNARVYASSGGGGAREKYETTGGGCKGAGPAPPVFQGGFMLYGNPKRYQNL